MTRSNAIFNHWRRGAALGLIFFAFALSAILSRTVFERLPHLEDEFAYLYQARLFAHGDLVIETPRPRQAYWQPFIVDHAPTGQRFGKYTPGWPALLAIGETLGERWLLNALFAALTVALVFRLGSRIFDPDVGLIAAALTAFSPMALLLNASLMGHTAALCFGTCFLWAYWRLEGAKRWRLALLWGSAAGLALGAMALTRPLTALAFASPFIVWSGVRVWRALWRGAFWRTLTPLLALSIGTLILVSAIPAFNAVATGDPTQNLYTLVWEYDRLGFGECCGRNVHTLEKGVRHTRFDLSLTAADLFGWQMGAFTPALAQHVRLNSGFYPLVGLSLFLLPLGWLAGLLYRVERAQMGARLRLALAWAVMAFVWALLPLHLGPEAVRSPLFAYVWVGVALAWVMLPLLLWEDDARSVTARWTWLLTAVVLTMVLVQMMYWVGSQRYSTRYYFEALTAASLIAALAIAYVLPRRGRWRVYLLLMVALLYGFTTYSLPRINALHGFNFISRAHIEAVEARRETARDVLVLVSAMPGGEGIRWRPAGPYMALTSPYLDSEFVAAIDYGGMRDAILARFPEREVIEIYASGNRSFFRATGEPVVDQ